MTGSFSDKVRRVPKSWIFPALIILFVIFIRLNLLDVPLERDEGEYAYMGQLLLEGVAPYGEAYNMKFPGTYLMYALFMAIFGESPHGIHIGLMIVNCAGILLVYLLALKVVDEISAALAGGAYAVLSLSPSVLGFAAHATHFVVLPALGGTLVLLSALKGRDFRLFCLSGVLLGISVVMKQTGIFFVLFGFAYILYRHLAAAKNPSITESEPANSLQALVFKLGSFSLGVSLPLVLTLLWLYVVGVFDRFWFWTVVYAWRYAAQVPFSEGLIRLKNSFLQVADGFFLLWIFSALGLVFLFFHKRSDTGKDTRAAGAAGFYDGVSRGMKVDKAFIVLFVFFSFLSICPGFYFRAHYYVTLLPAVSLLVSIFIDFLTSAKIPFFRLRIPRLIGAAIFIAAAAVGVVQQKNDLFTDDPVRLSGMTYFGNPFPESTEIARFIRERTDPNDRIAVLGSEPQILFYANRRSATGYIYMYGLMENHEYVLPMQKESIAEIEACRPKFLIDVNVPWSWGEQENSNTYIFRWAADYIAENYDLVGVVDMVPPKMSVYRWYDDAKNYAVQSPWSLRIYERR